MNLNIDHEDHEDGADAVPPFCAGCTHNQFEVMEIKPVNDGRTIEILVCASCKTVAGVIGVLPK